MRRDERGAVKDAHALVINDDLDVIAHESMRHAVADRVDIHHSIVSDAPELSPMIDGPASGLRVTPCMTAPAAARLPPMTAECALVIRTPSELIAALPYLLGYHPMNSVAMVGLTGTKVDFGACYDLPPPDCDAEDAKAAAAVIAETVARQDAAAIVIVGFGPPERVTPAVLRLAQALQTARVRVDDAMRVTDGRWWSYFCDDAKCCSPEGTLCLPADSVIAAEATFLGHVALPSRRELIARAQERAPDQHVRAHRLKRMSDVSSHCVVLHTSPVTVSSSTRIRTWNTGLEAQHDVRFTIEPVKAEGMGFEPT